MLTRVESTLRKLSSRKLKSFNIYGWVMDFKYTEEKEIIKI
ncbi:AraC family transcriptional regulator, partial [Escherichia coli]|nr:AraC family transcriptional regulator [Escherichia coli]